MATDYFLKVPGVDGEATDDKHKGEIEIESFSWGEVQPGTAGHGSGAGAAKVQKQDFSFVKKMDKSSPKLMIACATGEHFKNALLTVRKAGGTQQDYLKITMEDLIISSYTTNAGAGELIPTESVTLNFVKLEMSYKEQKPDGTLGGEVKQKYDFGANKKI
jgi:type VI secretion system secreted protein Hcp